MKTSQRGAISGAILGLGAVLLIMLIVAMNYITYSNYGNRTEMALNAKVENNENIYAQGTQKVVEIAQVPAMYVEDLTKVTTAAISGRYGADGSKAVFQMLREQNPSIDSAMYTKIQQVIESFRNEFQNNQTQMLDMRRSYQTELGNVWSGMWLRMAGYPRTDMHKYDIVSTDKAADAFKTHRDTGIQLRPSK